MHKCVQLSSALLDSIKLRTCVVVKLSCVLTSLVQQLTKGSRKID